MKLTNAFIIRPSGKVIQHYGIVPDVTLPSLNDDAARETNLMHSLYPPADQAALEGYDASLLPSRSRAVRKGLSDLEEQLRLLIEAGSLGHTEEDQQIEAAKRVALFLAAQAYDGVQVGPVQMDLPFSDD